mmetsp:Transcript_20465/g.65524  ORF Transcript_20465/g.65524 Transcript_20465/m.65524 type:complete len:448 (+) Transcript_20465:2-1345(+)
MSAGAAAEEAGKTDFEQRFADTSAAASELAKSGSLGEGVDRLLRLEKACRLANQWDVTIKAALQIVSLCYECGEWDALNANLVLLSKRRSQHQKVITAIVAEAMKFLERPINEAERLRLIETLRAVTEGKIYVELERAKLTRMLAVIKEHDGDLAGASTTLQEVQVETIGSMSVREKTEYVLEQMRLTMANSDFVRTKMLSNKISSESIRAKELQDLKLRYYDLMIQFHVHEDGPSELWRDFDAIYRTPTVQDDEGRALDTLRHMVLFLALTEYAIEPYTALEGLRKLDRKALEKLPAYQRLVHSLTTQEVIAWPLADESELHAHSVFNNVERWGESSAGWWDMLHLRVTEHNIRVVAKYYSRIQINHLARMLGLTEDKLERAVSNMVTGQQKLYARIDRPEGIISFSRPQAADEVLNDWSADISQLLDLVERTDHLINKEMQVHGK